MTYLMPTFSTFTEHMPLGKALSFGRWVILFWIQKDPEGIFDGAIKEICSIDVQPF
jgi:hypothetical protein